MSNERQQRAARAEQMRKEREKADRKQRNLITVGIVVVVIALIAVGGYAIKNENDKTTKRPSHQPEERHQGLRHRSTRRRMPAAGRARRRSRSSSTKTSSARSAGVRAGQRRVPRGAVKTARSRSTYRILSFLDRASPNEYSSRAGSTALCAFDEGVGWHYKKVTTTCIANQPEEQTPGPENPALVDVLKQLGVEWREDEVGVGQEVPPGSTKATEASREHGHRDPHRHTSTARRSPAPTAVPQAPSAGRRGREEGLRHSAPARIRRQLPRRMPRACRARSSPPPRTTVEQESGGLEARRAERGVSAEEADADDVVHRSPAPRPSSSPSRNDPVTLTRMVAHGNVDLMRWRI